MGLLYASELTDPNEWVLQNAQDILDSVRRAGGWKKVFPNGVPMWLHKLRNYFNVEPKYLRLVDESVTRYWMQDIRSKGQLNAFLTGSRTLSGHVYFDEEVEVWYQMGPGGSIYHWGGDVRFEKIEAAYTHAVRGQTGIPIFKLICPDGTGGSKETIIKNPKIHKVRVSTSQGDWYEMRASSKIGETNQTVMVQPSVVKVMKHQGSYNFSETAVVGLDAHKKSDVETHKKDAEYIDPPDRFAPLKTRIFKESVLAAAGAKTKMSSDFDEPPMRRQPHSV